LRGGVHTSCYGRRSAAELRPWGGALDDACITQSIVQWGRFRRLQHDFTSKSLPLSGALSLYSMHNSKFAASFDESELDFRAARITGAREKSMVAFLETVQQKWGRAEGYFKGVLGLDRETQEKVRDVMTVYEKNTTTT
jgi:hypothetical protein